MIPKFERSVVFTRFVILSQITGSIKFTDRILLQIHSQDENNLYLNKYALFYLYLFKHRGVATRSAGTT